MFKLDKKKIEIAVAAAGVLILIFGIISVVSKNKKKSRPQHFSSATKAVSSLAEKFDYAALNEKFSAIDWARDPFSLVTIKAHDLGATAVLTGIVWDADSPIAVFGDRFVKAGEEIQRYRILEIKQGTVMLSDGEAIYELRVGDALSFGE